MVIKSFLYMSQEGVINLLRNSDWKMLSEKDGTL